MKIKEMKLVFNAGFDSLKKIVARMDGSGEWRDLELGHQYRMGTGAILNYYPGTGTIMFQGPMSARRDMRAEFERALARSAWPDGAVSRHWPDIDFGQYRKSSMCLPEVVLYDPGWFFYIARKPFGAWRSQFDLVAERAQAIVPPSEYKGGRIEHLKKADGSYGGFCIVGKKEESLGNSRSVLARSDSLDLSYVWRTFGKNSIAQSKLLRSFKTYYSDGGTLRLTRRSIEQFFDNEANFDL